MSVAAAVLRHEKKRTGEQYTWFLHRIYVFDALIFGFFDVMPVLNAAKELTKVCVHVTVICHNVHHVSMSTHNELIINIYI